MTLSSRDGPLRERLVAHVTAAGYAGNHPLVVGVRHGDAPPMFLSRGRTLAGAALTDRTIVYTGSLSKQVVAVCTALLVRQGRLDLDSSLARWMPELPDWAAAIRIRHLIHHTSGLPEGVHLDDIQRAAPVRTTDGVVDALIRLAEPAGPPGTAFRYSNAGYVCLAVTLERAAGRPLPALARDLIFEPLGMTASQFWTGPAPHPDGAAPLDPAWPAPLSSGDGGVWSTARDLMRWNEALSRDELGISTVVHTPGMLDDGTPLDYAWAIGVHQRAGRRIYRHAGAWPGLTAELVRIRARVDGSEVPRDDDPPVNGPHDGLIVVLALDDDLHRTATLADALIDDLAGPATRNDTS